MTLDIVARNVEVAKANYGGVLKYKAMTDIVESMKPTIPWLTKRNVEKPHQQAESEDVIAATANNGRVSTSTLSSALTPSTNGNNNTLPGTTIPLGTSINAGEDIVFHSSKLATPY